MESDSKSSKLVGGIYPENKVIWTNENKLSDSLTEPKNNFGMLDDDGSAWWTFWLVVPNWAVFKDSELLSISV